MPYVRYTKGEWAGGGGGVMVLEMWDLRGIFLGDLGVQLFGIQEFGKNTWDLRLINYYLLSEMQILLIYKAVWILDCI